MGNRVRRRIRVAGVSVAAALAVAGAFVSRGAEAREATLPDLVVTSVSNPPSARPQTLNFAITSTVENLAGSAKKSLARYYLSTDALPDAQDVRLLAWAPRSVPALAAGVSDSATTTVTIPLETPPGAYFLIACADDLRQVTEADETNDCRTAAKTVTVQAAPAAPPGKTSGELIAAALASGKLSEQLALVYNLFALFADPRLPGNYRGVATPDDGAGVLGSIAARFGELSTELQSVVRPYYLPPIYSNSAFSVAPAAADASAPSVAAAGSQPCGGSVGTLQLDQWGSVATTNGKALVWWQKRYPEDEAKAQQFAAAIDSPIWRSLLGAMQKEPAKDGGDPCHGVDDRLDLYVIDIPSEDGVEVGGRWLPHGACGPAAGHIELPRTAPLPTLAHELMHAFIHGFPISDCADFYWLDDATATWAEDLTYPTLQTEQGYAAAFLDRPDRQLDADAWTGDLHRYGAYLLPFLVTRKFGDPKYVGKIWANAKSLDSLHAIDTALAGLGGLAKVWPLFVFENWNKPPLKDYQDWDGLALHAATANKNGKTDPSNPEIPIKLDGKGDFKLTLPMDVRYLAARYYRLTGFGSSNIRRFVFRNPFVDQTTGATSDSAASIRASDGKQLWEFTSLPRFGICYQFNPTLRPDEMVFMIGNSSLERGHVLTTTPDPGATFLASSVGCHYTGTVKGTETGSGESVSWKITNLQFSESYGTDCTASMGLCLFAFGTDANPATVRVSWNVAVPPCSDRGPGCSRRRRRGNTRRTASCSRGSPRSNRWAGCTRASGASRSRGLRPCPRLASPSGLPTYH